jgi:hypothetical protein
MVFLKSALAGLAALAGYIALLCPALWYGPILWLPWLMWRDGGGAPGFAQAIVTNSVSKA